MKWIKKTIFSGIIKSENNGFNVLTNVNNFWTADRKFNRV